MPSGLRALPRELQAARDEHGPKLPYQVLVYPTVQDGWDTPSALWNADGLPPAAGVHAVLVSRA